MRHRHERFLVSRLATGLVTMAALPPYLLWRGVPSAIEAAAFASLLLPVIAAVLLSRTGSLWIAHAVSSAGLTGLVVCLAMMTGGPASPAAVWLAVIPLEALVSGSWRATVPRRSSPPSASGRADRLAVARRRPGHLPSREHRPAGLRPGRPRPCGGPGRRAPAQRGRVARERLRSNEARDRLLLSAIDDLVTWHDCNGRVIEASASAIKLVGSDAATLRGHGLLKRVHVADRPALLSALSDVAATGRPATLAVRCTSIRPPAGPTGRT